MKSTATFIRLFIPTALIVASGSASAQSDRFFSADGDIIFTPMFHASAQVEQGGRIIHVDPWTVGGLSRAKPADLILITDDPSHHFDPAAVAALRKPGAPVVMTAKAQVGFPGGTVLENGQSGEFAGIRVEAVGAYDMTPGEPYHPKGEANGYVITLGGKRLFFAGVGECVPEIRALEDIYIAVMPMNLPVDRMRPIPLAECLKTFRPQFVYINHYDREASSYREDPQNNPPPGTAQDTPATIRALTEALEGEGIEFRDRGWYAP